MDERDPCVEKQLKHHADQINDDDAERRTECAAFELAGVRALPQVGALDAIQRSEHRARRAAAAACIGAQLKVANAEGLATQLTLLVDGAIAQDLVRNDPAMARAARDAAQVLLANAGISVDEPDAAGKPTRAAKKPAPKSTPPSSPRTRGSIRRDGAV